MLFGLPWWAIIPLVAIIGGFITKYREQELKHEEKRMASAKEIHELRKIIQNHKSRIENLEAKASSTKTESVKDIQLDDIEIKDEYYSDKDGKSSNRVRN